MTCERARKLARDMIWGKGEVSPAPRIETSAAMQEHLQSCPDCRAEMEELRALCAGLRSLGGRRAPADLALRTMSAVRLEKLRARRATRPAPFYLRRALAAGIAAAAIAAAGAYLAGHLAMTPAPSPSMTANMAPLVMEYADFRGAQPLGDRDAMTLVRAQMQEGKRP